MSSRQWSLLTFSIIGTYFTGILVMRRFVLDFGDPGQGPANVNGGYGITTSYTSLFASIVQAGEFFG